MYDDSPEDLAHELCQRLFGNHPLAMPILESLSSYFNITGWIY